MSSCCGSFKNQAITKTGRSFFHMIWCDRRLDNSLLLDPSQQILYGSKRRLKTVCCLELMDVRCRDTDSN